jgi:hypothetical protein
MNNPKPQTSQPIRFTSDAYEQEAIPAHLQHIRRVVLNLNARQCEILERLLDARLRCDDAELYNTDDDVVEEIAEVLQHACQLREGGRHE